MACADIDALNVFPVPDGDTGTNLLLTMRAACAALDDLDPGAATVEVAQVAAAGSLAGARGSSGVILSRFLHGLAAGLAADARGQRQEGAALQAALSTASDAAYAALSDPVEGTILSVARAAAKFARDADPEDVVAVARAAVVGARDELGRTTAQLPALAAAGVVDAGGQGLVVVLDALVDVLTGTDTLPSPKVATTPGASGSSIAGKTAFAYEVQYLLDAADDRLPDLRARLSALGDSVAIVSGDRVHNVHVHVDDVGAAIEAGIDVGRPHRITVTRFADQSDACEQPVAPPEASMAIDACIVAVSPSGGLADLFRAGGALPVEPSPDPAKVASTLVAAAQALAATSVVLLPNARDLVDAAYEAAAASRAAGRAATVVPTRSPMQGLAALAVHDPRRRSDDDAVAMSAAAAATRYAAVTKSAYDALTSAGPCHAGDMLGLIDDDVAVIGDDVAAVARELIDRMLIGGGELVTVVAGADAPSGLATALADYVQATRPTVETVVHDGGQPTFPILIGVE
jgi:DAK2 domain fusion protein YloV